MCVAAGELHQQVAAAQLQLLMLLLMLFDHLEVPAPAADSQGGPVAPADDTARNKYVTAAVLHMPSASAYAIS